MSDYVLVINAGSSSLKYSLVDAGTGEEAADGVVERIGESNGIITHRGPCGEDRTERRVETSCRAGGECQQRVVIATVECHNRNERWLQHESTIPAVRRRGPSGQLDLFL